MIVLTGAFHVVALVVLAAGAAKVAAPHAFATLLRSLGTLRPLGVLATFTDRASQRTARLVGVAEVVLGTVAVVYGGRAVAVVIAVVYVVFCVSVLAARRVGAASCGCFGSLSTPPGWRHVAIDAAAAAVAACAAGFDRALPVEDVMSDRLLAGVPYAVVVAAAAIGVIALSALPTRTR